MERSGKRIAFVLGGMTFGGAERVISILANHYAAMGWRVDIITMLKPECDFELDPSIRHLHLGGSARASRLLRVLWMPTWLLRLRRYLNKERPDALVSFAARINCMSLGMALTLPAKKRPRLIVSERNDPMKDTRTALVRRLTEQLYPRADRIVFQTTHAMNCFSEKVRKKGVIVPNPVDAKVPRADVPAKKIVAVGKLMRQKNHALLLDAFARLKEEFPGHTLRIYGDGVLREELQERIRSLGLEGRAVLEGWRTDVAEQIADAELFVLPSNYEGLSNALMEALAMGLPCVSTNCAGAEDLIEDGVNGRVVPVGDPDALTAAMRELLSDPASARRMGEMARRKSASFAAGPILERWDGMVSGRG